MKLLAILSALLCLFGTIGAGPFDNNGIEKRDVTSSGCAWCSPGPWTFDVACSTGEYYAVASSIENPPASVILNATAFCSEFLRPLVTDLSIINATGGTTTSTSTAYSLIMFTPTTTSSSMIMTSTAKPKSTVSAPPSITPLPMPQIAAALLKRDFTVPDYLTAWYYYGRLDPGCSCIITSALPSIVTSPTTTSTSYYVTLSTTITETYTIYP
ncbi:uncharacterized protein LY89DRAFT_740798 [Mollisia scopiformis]|uniref:Uncharacterized protein n=1 Tax=Mollisia scopiformis TaxID=149040 RepID=A0A132BBD7_MOLSC|nr:uncharacterized protein LY89DRAFT_740798 [Mollisia scopiformis]KUJ09725.1 hypothetical protein LY89DRAFT_740798 [Mollisia scopiformis]